MSSSSECVSCGRHRRHQIGTFQCEEAIREGLRKQVTSLHILILLFVLILTNLYIKKLLFLQDLLYPGFALNKNVQSMFQKVQEYF